jgi:hypothetical protein
MKLRGLTTTFCLTTLLIGMANLVQSSASAESERTENSCKVAMNRAKERITRGRDLRLVSFGNVDVALTYPDHPNGRPLILQIVLEGKAASSVMSSPAFQKTVASEIIRSCGSVSAINFAMYRSGWVSMTGLMPDGTIQGFQCFEADPRLKLSWGQQVCSL